MNAYKFFTLEGKPFVKNFASDDDAFRYESEFNDTSAVGRIERLKDSDWFAWDTGSETWVFCPRI